MRAMDERRNGWRRVFDLADDLSEWMQLLEEEGRDDVQPIWSNLNTEEVINLVEELLQEFKGCLKGARGKIDQFEKATLQRIGIEAQEFLNSFRKERQI